MEIAFLLRDSPVNSTKCPSIVILQRNKTTIGRRGDVKMDTINGKEISKKHACIFRHFQKPHDVWVIEDNKSLNGTFVNSKKIFRHILVNGDEIVFGCGFTFSYGDMLESTGSAECRYRFFINPPKLKFGHKIDTNTVIEETESDVCPVCYMPIVQAEKLPCGHRFCRNCVREWAIVCRSTFKPCICPMCRTEFSSSQIRQPEAQMHYGKLKVSSVEGILRDLDVQSCNQIKKMNIFQIWDNEQKEWFWRSLRIVKNNYLRRMIFLHLVSSMPIFIFRAPDKELEIAMQNFGLDACACSTREKKILSLIMHYFLKLNQTVPFNVMYELSY